MVRVLVFASFLLMPSLASAQFNPYNPPSPGWVVYQPCNGEIGWVPPDHPLALVPPCAPAPAAPNPEQPWTLKPDEPMELGHAYRDPYGLVWFITRIELRLVYDTTRSAWTTVGTGEYLLYQSEDAYRENRNPWPQVFNPLAPRGVRWEIQ